MIMGMKNYVRIGIITTISLSLASTQAFWGAPAEQIPVSFSPIELSMSIMEQVREAAQNLKAPQTKPGQDTEGGSRQTKSESDVKERSRQTKSKTDAKGNSDLDETTPGTEGQSDLVESESEAKGQSDQKKSGANSKEQSSRGESESDAKGQSSRSKSESDAKGQSSRGESESESEGRSDLLESESGAEGRSDLVESESESVPSETMPDGESPAASEEDFELLKELLDAQMELFNTALTEGTDQFSDFNPFPLNPFGGILPDVHEKKEETEMETETETETELPIETETEFHPVEMGAAIPDTGQALIDETETESEMTGGESSETEIQSESSGETEENGDKGNGDDPVLLNSRHGVFAVPEVDGLNTARINLYDYRMLREYPLSRLPKDLHDLNRQLAEQTAEYEGTWSVFVQNLTTGQITILNDVPMRSASVMKLFIMGTLYEAFDHGDVERNDETVSLLRDMIINSSNGASNRLLEILGEGDLATGVARVNEFLRLRGFSSGTVEYNGFQDSAAIVDPDHGNTIMAKDVGLLLNRIYRRAFISRKVCNEIEQMMLDQGTRYKIPRGLPEGVQCGNKSGETSSIANDAAVIYGPTTDYILVVLSNDWSSENTANEQIVEVSKTVYRFFEG